MDDEISSFDAFDKPNEVLYEATRGIAEIINVTGQINADFADVRTVMLESGEALMGCGVANGENRTIEAAQNAIHSPLLDGVNIKGAKNILLNVTGSKNLTMKEVMKGNEIIYEAAGEEANVIFGLVQRDEMNENVSYTVIATGFKSNYSNPEKKSKKPSNLNQLNKSGSFFYNGYAQNRTETKSIADSKDLDVPTIIRVRGTHNLSEEETSLPKAGFNYHQYDAFEDDSAKRNSENQKEKEEVDKDDSSSFLRMMMD
jgi:cell division protein FtsZ